MNKTALFIVVTTAPFILSGCFSLPYWDHPNLSERDFDRDVIICQGKAALAPDDNRVVSRYEIAFKGCMYEKGYYLTEE